MKSILPTDVSFCKFYKDIFINFYLYGVVLFESYTQNIVQYIVIHVMGPPNNLTLNRLIF